MAITTNITSKNIVLLSAEPSFFIFAEIDVQEGDKVYSFCAGVDIYNHLRVFHKDPLSLTVASYYGSKALEAFTKLEQTLQNVFKRLSNNNCYYNHIGFAGEGSKRVIFDAFYKFSDGEEVSEYESDNVCEGDIFIEVPFTEFALSRKSDFWEEEVAKQEVIDFIAKKRAEEAQ